MRISRTLIALPLLVFSGVSCLDNVDPQLPDQGFGDLPTLALEVVHAGVSSPTDLQAPDDGTGRLFVVQQEGLIRMSDGETLQAVDDAFLDIRDRVVTESLEQGLLGLAFHPDFATNGQFYVVYTRTGDEDEKGNTVLAEFTVSTDHDHANPNSEVRMLGIEQPSDNHQGGQLQFGPDGYAVYGHGRWWGFVRSR